MTQINLVSSVGSECSNDNARTAKRSPHRSPPSIIVGVTLFSPGIAAIVVAARFPKARPIDAGEFDALQPLCALPEVEFRDHQTDRSAVFPREWRPLPAVRQ